jgi:glycerol-3-phosphate dehydrogenase subunit B
MPKLTPDTIVVGAGWSGLVAAIRLAQEGQRVTLLTKGLGGIQLSAGTIDLAGYAPDRVTAPFEGLAALAADPGHPYAVIGAERVRLGAAFVQALVPDLLTGDLDRNVVLPTAVGAWRPTCLYQPSMAAALEADRIAVVGPRQLKDFSPELCAANLARNPHPSGRKVTATAHRIDLPARPGEADSPSLAYARALDRPDFRDRFAAAVKPVLGAATAVGLPAVLGLKDHLAWSDLEAKIGKAVFEITLIPPSVPGMRVNEALTDVARDAGVRIVLGSKVTGFAATGDQVTSVTLHQAGRDQAWAADQFVYAPGGWESGAIALDSYGKVSETVFGLPLRGADVADANADLLTGDYWHDQQLFEIGVAVDDAMRPVGPDGAPVYRNLYAAGSLLAGATRWSEKSGEGIALGSAWAAAESILGR